MSNDSCRLDALLSRVVDGTVSSEEFVELETALRSSADARRRYLHAMDLHAELQARGALSFGEMRVVQGGEKKPLSWFRWGSRAAMAAGVTVGVFGTSLVFGSVAAVKTKGIALLRESFENGPTPRVTGVPLEPGAWSGDYSDLVSAQGAVRPATGKKMLRFLRADYEGKPNAQGSRTSGVWRVLDLRAYRAQILEGSAEVQLSALVNTSAAERDYSAFVSVYAWTSEGLAAAKGHDSRYYDAHALALSRGQWVKLDRAPATWQSLDSALRLPVETEFVAIQAAIKQVSAPDIPVEFGEQYLDHVRMTLWSRVPMQ